ncbi:hypothetical protein GOODEAATRI_031338 [Goodea atripinnis]|uniref:Uncharacterized protein n=1 Tax=Goodea atripinnis TaxID=208336 RepID=A0ABV0NHL7_9TELE
MRMSEQQQIVLLTHEMSGCVCVCMCVCVLEGWVVWGGLLKKNLFLTPDDIFGSTSKVRGRSVQAAYREPLLLKKFTHPYNCVCKLCMKVCWVYCSLYFPLHIQEVYENKQCQRFLIQERKRQKKQTQIPFFLIIKGGFNLKIGKKKSHWDPK